MPHIWKQSKHQLLWFPWQMPLFLWNLLNPHPKREWQDVPGKDLLWGGPLYPATAKQSCRAQPPKKLLFHRQAIITAIRLGGLVNLNPGITLWHQRAELVLCVVCLYMRAGIKRSPQTRGGLVLLWTAPLFHVVYREVHVRSSSHLSSSQPTTRGRSVICPFCYPLSPSCGQNAVLHISLSHKEYESLSPCNRSRQETR